MRQRRLTNLYYGRANRAVAKRPGLGSPSSVGRGAGVGGIAAASNAVGASPREFKSPPERHIPVLVERSSIHPFVRAARWRRALSSVIGAIGAGSARRRVARYRLM